MATIYGIQNGELTSSKTCNREAVLETIARSGHAWGVALDGKLQVVNKSRALAEIWENPWGETGRVVKVYAGKKAAEAAIAEAAEEVEEVEETREPDYFVETPANLPTVKQVSDDNLRGIERTREGIRTFPKKQWLRNRLERKLAVQADIDDLKRSCIISDEASPCRMIETLLRRRLDGLTGQIEILGRIIHDGRHPAYQLQVYTQSMAGSFRITIERYDAEQGGMSIRLHDRVHPEQAGSTSQSYDHLSLLEDVEKLVRRRLAS